MNFTSTSNLTNNHYTIDLKGQGILPKIVTTNYTFPDRVMLGDSVNADDIDGYVSFANTSYTSPLKIKKITKLDLDQSDDFFVDTTLPDDLINIT